MSETKVIVAGWFTVDPSKRDEAIACHQDLIKRARKAPGCLDLAISADTVDPARVNNFELWQSQKHLDEWRAVANPPKDVAPITGGDMHKHEISSSGSPF